MFALDVHNVCITFAAASYAVLLDGIPRLPVIVFLSPLLLINSRHLQEGGPSQLTIPWSICWTVLNRGMSVANISEIVDIFRS